MALSDALVPDASGAGEEGMVQEVARGPGHPVADVAVVSRFGADEDVERPFVPAAALR